MKLPNKYRPAALLSGLLAFGAAPYLGAQEATPEQDVVVLSPFTTYAPEETSLWAVDQSSGGTRVAVPVKELPFTLDVLTTSFMEDFIISDLGEVLTQMANIGNNDLYTGAGSGNSIRGFSQFYQLRNGFYRNGVIDRTLVSRVEVVKGPYAAIYGRGEPGGVVNYITKRPVFGKYSGQLTFELGENNTSRVQLEQNIGLGKRTAVLLAGSYADRDFDQQWAFERSRTWAAVLRHQFSSKTELILEYEHMFRRNNRGRPLTDIRLNGRDPVDNVNNKYIGEWAFDFMKQYGWQNTLGPNHFADRKLDTVNLTLTHQFSRDVALRVAYNDSKTTQDYDYQANGNATILVDPVTRQFVRWDGVFQPLYRQLPSDVMNLQADLTVKFETGKVKHTTLLTLDYNNQLNGAVSRQAPRGNRNDVHTFNYGTGTVPNYTNDAGALHGSPFSPIAPHNPAISFKNTPEYYTRVGQNLWTEFDIYGVFLMHRVRLLDDKLLIMAGSRYDSSTSEALNKLSPDLETVVSRTEAKVDDLTYNVGANYYLTPKSVFFAGFSTSFNPKGDVYSHNGEPMPNERGEGLEVGFRTQLLDEKFDVGVSYFEIERQNVRARNPDFEVGVDSPSEKPQFTPNGLDRATGFELSANGKLTRSFSVRLSAGKTDAKHVTNLDPWKEGMDLARVPRWNFALGANYRITQGKLKGLSLNASYRHQSDYRVQDVNQPANQRWLLRSEEGGTLDLAAGYNWRTGARDSQLKHTVRVSVRNALDDIFIESTQGYYSMGRMVMASYTLNY